MNIVKCTLLLWGTMLLFSVHSTEYRVIMTGKDEKTEAGFVGNNMYSDVAVLNPSVHRSAVKLEEFGLYMPSKDSDNRDTYDEEKARIRLFFKPSVRAKTARGRRVYLVGEGRWKLEKVNKGTKYSRNWKRNNNKVLSEITVTMADKKAEITIEGTFTNKGSNDCVVEFAPQFSFLRNKELVLMIPRKYTDIINGRQKSYFYGEKVVLDNSRVRSYFWRKAAKDYTTGFVDYVARERIPFNNPALDRFDVFGFVQLPGKSNLVWDIRNAAEAESLQYIEFGWENGLADTVAAWNVQLKRGETKKVKFRLLTVKGLSRFDAVSENILVGYGVERDKQKKDRLKIEMAPLCPTGISILNGNVINAQDKQVLIKREDVELAEMQPFNPGKMEWPPSTNLDRSSSYPIKISLKSKADGNLLLQAEGVIAP